METSPETSMVVVSSAELSTDAATLVNSFLTAEKTVKAESYGPIPVCIEGNDDDDRMHSPFVVTPKYAGEKEAATAALLYDTKGCLSTEHNDSLDNGELQANLNLDESSCNLNCCNCSSRLDRNLDSKRMLNEAVTCQILLLRSKELSLGSVKIRDVLKALCHRQNWNSSSESNTSLLNKNEAAICSKCVDILVRLYNLYNEFLSISILSGSPLAREVIDKAKLFQNTVIESVSDSASDAPLNPVTTKPKGTGISNINRNQVLKRQVRRIRNNQVGKTMLQAGSINKVDNQDNITDSKLNTQSVKMTKSLKSGSFAAKTHQMNDVQLKISSTFEKKFIQSKFSRRVRKGASVQAMQECVLESSTTSHINASGMDDETVSDTCDRCGKRFKTFGGLKIHYASHLRDDNKIACKECGKRFRKPEALELHERIDHKGYKPYKCPHDGCERNFRLKDKLKLHIKVIHEKNKPFPCPKCEKTFRTRYHLKAHDVAQHIQGNSTIGCSQCRRKFPSQEALDIHMAFHDEEKRFTCTKCNKGFKTASRLRVHSKSHDTLPSAVCPTCGKAYKHVRDLRLHEVSHEEESSYRFACGDCPRKFYRIDLLRVHQSNEKHFSQEIIGPCVAKSTDVTVKVFKKNQKKGLLIRDENPSNGNKSDAGSFHCKAPLKTKRKLAQKVKVESKQKEEPNYDCLGSPAIFPSMVPVDNVEFSSSSLEMAELIPTLTNTLIANSFRKNLPDMSDQSSFILNSKDPVLSNLDNTNNSGLSIPIAHASQFSLPIQTSENGDTIYTIKDSSDRSITSFSISTGAEQIGYDVINAFINNLN